MAQHPEGHKGRPGLLGRSRSCLPLSKSSRPVSRQETISMGSFIQIGLVPGQARLTSSFPPAQYAAAACRDSERASVSSRWVQPTPGPLAVPRRARGRAEFHRSLTRPFSWTLLQIPLALPYTGPVSVRMILKHERGLWSPDQTLPLTCIFPKLDKRRSMQT